MALRKKRNGGASFIIHDHLGRLILVDLGNFTASCILQTELGATWKRLTNAIFKLGCQRIVLEGESLAVIFWILNIYLLSLLDLHYMISSFGYFSVQHVYS